MPDGSDSGGGGAAGKKADGGAGAAAPLVADYGFPLKPYPLQRDLMDRVYDVLSRGGVGILESPTGTGKTLALLCPAIAWLRANERRLLEAPAEDASELAAGSAEVDGGGGKGLEDDLEDWALEHRAAMARQLGEHIWRQRRRMRDIRKSRARCAGALTSEGTVQKVKVRRGPPPGVTTTPLLGDMEFSLEAPPELPMPDGLLGMPSDLEAGGGDDEGALQDSFEGKMQIIFCSRTHSQLAQVLGEIKRISPVLEPQTLSVVTLGARSNLCVNEAIRTRARGSAAHLNELCRLATAKEEKAPGACCLKKQAHFLADACSSSMLDLEEMVQRGRAPVGGGCPYYGSREAAREADVVLVPYSSMVNAETRRRLGIRTEGSILIFDEAHNLLEAIGDANSVTLTLAQMKSAVDDLALYASKYEARLAPANALRLKQLRQFCMRLHDHLGAVGKSKAFSVGGFLVDLGVDHFDLPELSRFLEATELPRKVRGYVESLGLKNQVGSIAASNSSVYGVTELLVALQNSTSHDRILSQTGSGDGETASVRYLSLDAEVRFRDLLASARAVIFAGGTLEPRAEFSPLYTGKVPDTRVANFAGRHIVPSSHVLVRYVTHGPNGHALDFRRDSRDKPAQRSELAAIIASCAASTPGGCVFFFPSFEYLGMVAPSAGSRLGGREVIVETRGNVTLGSSNSLQAFHAAIQRDGGAVLLAVCGGKLSEGINFTDRLCRLVAVAGLPYPNASDLGLTEKMRFLDSCRLKGAQGLSGREFYTARCMKGVNQCIGRSIRHAQDWAAMLLLDHRYAQANINCSISSWLREEAAAKPFIEVDRELGKFFTCHIERCLAVSSDKAPTSEAQKSSCVSPPKLDVGSCISGRGIAQVAGA